MANLRDSWCFVPERFISSYGGKVWSDPKEEAWINWPKQVFTKMLGPEKEYIKKLYNGIVTGKEFDGNGNVTSYNKYTEIGSDSTVPNSSFRLPVRDSDFADTKNYETVAKWFEKNPWFALGQFDTYDLGRGDSLNVVDLPDFARARANTRKFLFFDIMNLAPTMEEFMGYTAQPGVNFGDDNKFPRKKGVDTFWNNLYITGSSKTEKYWNTPWIYSEPKKATNATYKWMEHNQLADKYLNKYQNDSLTNSPGSYYNYVNKYVEFEYQDMIQPYQEEFKLSWLRQLVQLGLEDSMGPFVTKFKTPASGKTMGEIDFHTLEKNGFRMRQFGIGNLNNFIKYQNDYKSAYLYDWALNEWEWVSGQPDIFNQYNIRHNWPTSDNYEWAKAPKSYLEQLKDGGAISDRGTEKAADGYPAKPNWFVIWNAYNQKNDFKNWYRTYNYTIGGLQTSEIYHPWSIRIPGSNSALETPMSVYGIRPHYKTDKDKRNNIVSGWIVLPNIYGNIKLPWPFVWKYIGADGFYEWPGKAYGTATGQTTTSPSITRPGKDAPDPYPGYGPKWGDETFGGNGFDVLSQLNKGNAFDENGLLRWKRGNTSDISSEALLRGGREVLNDMRVPGTTNIGNNSRANYHYRLRLWWYKYTHELKNNTTSYIPDRELVFYLRMKYGISSAVGDRYIVNVGQDILTMFGDKVKQTWNTYIEFLKSIGTSAATLGLFISYIAGGGVHWIGSLVGLFDEDDPNPFVSDEWMQAQFDLFVKQWKKTYDAFWEQMTTSLEFKAIQQDCLICGGFPRDAAIFEEEQRVPVMGWLQSQRGKVIAPSGEIKTISYWNPEFSRQERDVCIRTEAEVSINGKKEKKKFPHLLRSQYTTLIQDISGWPRFSQVDGLPITPSKLHPATRMIGGDQYGFRDDASAREEIIDWKKLKGYYTFNGQGPDRPSSNIGDYYVSSKSNVMSAIKKNDIPLYQLLELDKNNMGASPLRPTKDRFSSPEHLMSYDWRESNGTTIPPKPIDQQQMIYFHNMAVFPSHGEAPQAPGQPFLPLTVKNQLHPALFSPKELQFLYEMVSYVLYGNTELNMPADSSRGRKVIWQETLSPSEYKANGSILAHRWMELYAKNNVSLFDLTKKFTNSNRYNRAYQEFENFRISNEITTLSDYILWAAPTEDQFRKTNFSTIDEGNNFVNMYRTYKSYLNNEKFMRDDVYPFHKFAKSIEHSETDRPFRPIVPAIVHYRYMTAKLNSDLNYTSENNDQDPPTLDWITNAKIFGYNMPKLYNNVQESSGVNEWAMPIDMHRGLSKEDRRDIQRVMGGRINSANDESSNENEMFNNYTDEFVLIGLPQFVLGGRPDLGEDASTWDPKWGECPFTMVNNKLVVGNLDKVIDRWAKQIQVDTDQLDHVTDVRNGHNGQYVSAMEIAFWIRYRHGLAAAPGERRVKHFRPNSVINDPDPMKPNTQKIWNLERMGEYKHAPTPLNFGIRTQIWPPFVKEFYIKGETDRMTLEGNILLNKNANPDGTTGDDGPWYRDLLPTETLNGIPLLTSYYSPILVDPEKCVDPLIERNTANIATPNAKNLSDPKWEISAYTGFNSYYACYWPDAKLVTTMRKSNYDVDVYKNSNLARNHVVPYLNVHWAYNYVERTYYPKEKYLVLGFDKSPNSKDCLHALHAENIQAWFKAYRLLHESQKYADYIEQGLQLKEGHPDSVLEVKGELLDQNGDSEGDLHFYISGASVGSWDTTFRAQEDGRVLSFKERMRIRPWVDRFEVMAETRQEAIRNLCDDYYLGTANCAPRYFYMRHILQPDQFMWISERREFNGKFDDGMYSYEQVDRIKTAMTNTLVFWTKWGYATFSYFGEVDPETSFKQEVRTLPYSQKITGLALQHMMLSTSAAEWKFDSTNQSDIRKMPRFSALLRYYTGSSEIKFYWNTAQKALTTALTAVVNFTHISNPLHEAVKTGRIASEVLELYEEANHARLENIPRMANITDQIYNNILSKKINVLGKERDFGAKNILKYSKYFLEAVNAGWVDFLGIDRPGGVKSKDTPETLARLYTYSKPIISFGKDYVFDASTKYLTTYVTDAILASRAAAAGGEAAAIAAGLGVTTVMTGGAMLAIALLSWAIQYTVDRIIELWELNSKLEELWKLIHKAHNKGYLEGPYLQSGGTVAIKKLKSGGIPILGKTYNPDDSSPEATTAAYLKSLAAEKDKGIAAISQQVQILDEITPVDKAKYLLESMWKLNENFYKYELDKILKDIQPDSCECEFFKGIFEDEQSDYKDIKDWKKGHFKRRHINRFNVVDEAPNYRDNPAIFYTSGGPYAEIAWWIEEWAPWQTSTDMYGRRSIPSGGRRNIRTSGQNGLAATVESGECPRFWWPSILVTPNIDLCKYMTLKKVGNSYEGGYYPQAEPEDFDSCGRGFFVEERLNVGETGIKSVIDGAWSSERDRASSGLITDFFINASPSIITNRKSLGMLYVLTTYRKSGHSGKQIRYAPMNSTDIEIYFNGNSRKLPVNLLYSTLPLSPVQASRINTGDTIYSTEGVHGPAPPHEREIISLFRRKYKIDMVSEYYFSQVVTVQKDKELAKLSGNDLNEMRELSPDRQKLKHNVIFNPYKFGFNLSETEGLEKTLGQIAAKDWYAVKSNCCSVTATVVTELTKDGNSREMTSEEKNKLRDEKRKAAYCEYVITLNTDEFKRKILNVCNSKDKADNTEETRNNLTQDLPTPNTIPPPEDCSDDILLGRPCGKNLIPTDGEEDPKLPPPHFSVQNPTIPNCTNCDPHRPFVVENRDIIVSELTPRGRFRLALGVDLGFSFFNLFSLKLDFNGANTKHNWRCPEWIQATNGCWEYYNIPNDKFYDHRPGSYSGLG